MKALLVQQGLHKTLQEKSTEPAGMSDENWEEMDMKAANTIQLCLAYEVMYNVMDKEMTTCLWSRLETLYMTNTPTSCILRNNYMSSHERRDNNVGAFKLLQQGHQRASSC